jgi:hypothetical protein
MAIGRLSQPMAIQRFFCSSNNFFTYLLAHGHSHPPAWTLHGQMQATAIWCGGWDGCKRKRLFDFTHSRKRAHEMQFCDFSTKFMFLMCLKLPRGAWFRLGLVVVNGHELFLEILRATSYVGHMTYSTSLFNFLSSMVVLIKFHVFKKMINNYAFQILCEQEDHLNY